MLRILSLGWGVQSFTLAAMSALGEIEGLDFAIHSDTTHERVGTYTFAERWTGWLEDRGLKVITVGDPDRAAKVDLCDPPFFTVNGKKKGQLRRQCTKSWKIYPVRRWISEELAARGLTKRPGIIEQWLGISTDEAVRMKDSGVQYITNRWPLIELGMSRIDCMDWMKSKDLEIPVKSSCVFCPYQGLGEWQQVKRNDLDWEKAIRVDEEIRELRPPYPLFVHQGRIPITEIDLRSDQDKGQLSLWDQECEGMCGV